MTNEPKNGTQKGKQGARKILGNVGGTARPRTQLGQSKGPMKGN